MFIVVNSLGFLASFKIFVLAINIIDEIQILSRTKIEDIRSLPENIDKDIYEYDEKLIMIEVGAIIIRIEVIIHQ